jgi:hypothetical protein
VLSRRQKIPNSDPSEDLASFQKSFCGFPSAYKAEQFPFAWHSEVTGLQFPPLANLSEEFDFL